MSTEDTRDIAVAAEIKIDAHIDDCVRFREILSKQYDETRKSINELSDRVTSMQLKVAAALGVLIFAGKIVDWMLEYHK